MGSSSVSVKEQKVRWLKVVSLASFCIVLEKGGGSRGRGEHRWSWRWEGGSDWDALPDLNSALTDFILGMKLRAFSRELCDGTR